MGLTLGDIWTNIEAGGNAEFLVSRDHAFTYGQLGDAVRGFCAEFDRRRIQAGARILIAAKSETVASAAFVAALLDGLVPVMLSPDTPPERFRAIQASVEPGLVLADGTFESRLRGTAELIVPAPDRTHEGTTVTNDGWFSGLLRRGRSQTGNEVRQTVDLPEHGRSPRLPDDLSPIAYILFTSGTTQAPTGVRISRQNLLAHLATLKRLFGYGTDSRIFNATPLAHTDGLVQGPLLAAAAGAALIRPGTFSVSELEGWLNLVRRSRATHYITTPTVLAMIERYAEHSDYFDAPEFRGIISSAAILRPDLWRRIQDRFKTDVFNLYGMTETVANALYAGALPELGPFGTIGFPIDCDARLSSIEGLPAVGGDESIGELQLRGENIFPGYWRNPERTRRTFTDDGWMRTGDIARLRSDGAFEILGRIKTAFNSGGTLIRPEEIDEALLRHSAVAEAATVGMPDEDFEEVPVSAVVLERHVSEAELTAHCRAHLEVLKVPKRVLAVERIPRGDAGKTRLEELREVLEALLLADSGHRSSGRQGSEADRVRAVAAMVFRMDANELGPASSPDTVAGWDSFTHITLVLAIEEEFGIQISPAKVAGIRSLRDIIDEVGRVKA